MPSRSKFRAAKPRPTRHVSGNQPKLETRAPSTTATTNGEMMIGVLFLTTYSTTNATEAIIAAAARPGKCFVVNIAPRD